MRVIGARQTRDNDLVFKSSDEKTIVRFSMGEKGNLQIDVNGDWLWLGPNDAQSIIDWIGSAK